MEARRLPLMESALISSRESLEGVKWTLKEAWVRGTCLKRVFLRWMREKAEGGYGDSQLPEISRLASGSWESSLVMFQRSDHQGFIQGSIREGVIFPCRRNRKL